MTTYSKEDKEKIIPVAESLEMMEKSDGWNWLKNKVEEQIKKQLDILIENDDINVDLVRGEIKGMKFMFNLIKEIQQQSKRIREDEEG